MKNNYTQVTPDTKPNTSEDFSKVPVLTEIEQRSFLAQVSLAKQRGFKEIEVDEQVMKVYGGENDHFSYQGVLCYRKGKSEEVKARQKISLDSILHGDVSTIEGRT
jgi:hypothetical protein